MGLGAFNEQFLLQLPKMLHKPFVKLKLKTDLGFCSFPSFIVLRLLLVPNCECKLKYFIYTSSSSRGNSSILIKVIVLFDFFSIK